MSDTTNSIPTFKLEINPDEIKELLTVIDLMTELLGTEDTETEQSITTKLKKCSNGLELTDREFNCVRDSVEAYLEEIETETLIRLYSKLEALSLDVDDNDPDGEISKHRPVRGMDIVEVTSEYYDVVFEPGDLKLFSIIKINDHWNLTSYNRKGYTLLTVEGFTSKDFAVDAITTLINARGEIWDAVHGTNEYSK